MFDPMDFEHTSFPLEDARELLLSDAKRLERPARQRFEVLARVPLRVIDNPGNE